MSVRQGHHLIQQRARQLLDIEQAADGIRRKIVERKRSAAVDATQDRTAISRWGAVGQAITTTVSSGRVGTELLAQPVLDRRQSLRTVDHDHTRLVSVDDQELADGVLNPGRRGTNPAAVHLDHSEPSIPGSLGVRAQDGGLADSARSVNPQHTEGIRPIRDSWRWISCHFQPVGEKLELGRAPDKAS
jgi:hypothetical protein